MAQTQDIAYLRKKNMLAGSVHGPTLTMIRFLEEGVRERNTFEKERIMFCLARVVFQDHDDLTGKEKLHRRACMGQFRSIAPERILVDHSFSFMSWVPKTGLRPCGGCSCASDDYSSFEVGPCKLALPISPVTFRKASTARSYFSILLSRAPAKSNLISSTSRHQ